MIKKTKKKYSKTNKQKTNKQKTNKQKTNKQKTNKQKTNNTLKYCCLDSKKKKECVHINKELKLNYTFKPKYAITTLLFGSDSYLPGVLLLGSSILNIMPKEYKKYITLCCMVTHDISPETRKLISKIYDRVIVVDYLQIPQDLIKHKNPKTQSIYCKTFTKLRIYEMTDYDKVLFMDSDMLVIKKDIISLFNLNTPAAVFLGKVGNTHQDRYFKEFKKNGKLFNQFHTKYCQWKTNKHNNNTILHGNLIPYNKKYENENASDGMNIETSVLLIKPSKYMANEVTKYLENIITNKIKIRGDTEMVSRMFKDKLYAIEPRFFGRWVNPEEHPELVVLDLYGSDGKPWDTTQFKELIKYSSVGDVSYWWDMYKTVYENEYKKWNNKMLDNLYNTIINIPELETI